MRSRRFQPQRYQLTKDAARVVLTGHPWIFRSHLSSAAEVFRTGQWLRLVDAQNETLGFGIYDREGLIGIRVLKQGSPVPEPAWFGKKIEAALAKREKLRAYTDAFRALHGENDGLPGVVIDVYGDTAVLQTYAPSVDVVGRYLAERLASRLELKNLVWKLPVKRKGREGETGFRCLRGHVPAAIRAREGKLQITVEVGEGQKSGTFLDLRGLRKWLSLQKLDGCRVLNLFSYTGTLGLAAEVAGAAEVWNVDISKGALAFAKKHHSRKADKHRFIAADIFEWLKELPPKEKFDLIIVDPPMMASRVEQVPNALRAYKQIYAAVFRHLAPKGRLVAACCTSRIARKRFRLEVDKAVGGRLKFSRSIEPEDDHPVGFAEGDYLKILVYG
jgi:23S rRNA G2069 N7-methylase RlmK/C1962 C5-methylase RlmI